MRDYLAIFGRQNKFKNPNGCPVKATFFVSHEWTDYNEVERIAKEGGHEIASNSITHESLRNAGTGRWIEEMDGQRLETENKGIKSSNYLIQANIGLIW